MKTQIDIPYSQTHQPVRTFDLFIPEGAPDGRAVFFIHGGGWSGGGKAGWHGPARYLADRGAVCASMEYRLLPDWPHPAQIEDVRLAMARFRAMAGELGFDPHRIAAAGSSAGGHLAALLATIRPDDPLGATPELTETDTRPDAAICYCPAVDLHPEANFSGLMKTIVNLLGGTVADHPERYRNASPSHRLDGTEPPFLFIHGDADPTIPLAQSQDMADALRARGTRADLMILPGVGHGFGYGTASDAQQAALAAIETFLDGIGW